MTIASVGAMAAEIVDAIQDLPVVGGRKLIAIAGPPASGKSTIAAKAQKMAIARGMGCGLVPMDGFHLHNDILDKRGQRAVKGSPETFDIDGFAALLIRLSQRDEVYVPDFDRALDASIACAKLISGAEDVVLVEGNYLLLNEPGWRDLNKFWDMSFFLQVDQETLENRIMARWLDHGFDREHAQVKAQGNDLPNARRVMKNLIAPDVTLVSG